MPTKLKQNDQVNLWPTAAILVITFTLLVSIGIVILLGTIQQLRYISWEKSLREAESSLAAEKELLVLSRKVLKLIDLYNQSLSPETLRDLEQNLIARQSLQQKIISTDPAIISQTLLSTEKLNQLPQTLQQHAETSISTSARIQSKLNEVSGYHYYDIATDQGTRVLISSSEYPLNSTVNISGHYISPSYIIEE
jgi:hypothetical protein